MDPQEFYKRVAGIIEPGLLRSKRVAVIGLGSGGSRVAAELGRLGIELLLVERPEERLEEHNLVRHLLGYRSLGKSKLDETLSHIRNLNPSVGLKACPMDVLKDAARLEERLRSWRPDLLAVCTDTEQSKHAVNEVALRLGIPQTGAGVYDGGIGGEVYRVRPGQACYGCIAAQLQLQRHTPKPRSSPDYNHLDLNEVPPTCALSLDIEQIAILQCRMTLELLLGDKSCSVGTGPEVNLWVFANRLVPGTFDRPLHCEFFRVPKQEDCLVCGKLTGNVDAEAKRILVSVGVLSGAGRQRRTRKSPQRRKRRTPALAANGAPGELAGLIAAPKADL
jgi:molybdopterin/thiamine biosynthesis adenylyltransferase